jgi:branched-chain amino acid transport system substrate-binding protein
VSAQPGRAWTLGTASLVLLSVLAPAPARSAAPPVPSNVRAADALAAIGPSRDRDRSLAKWAERASLAEIMWVLRRPPRELGPAEALLASAAFDKTPESRRVLRQRLLARIQLSDPKLKPPRSAAGLAPATFARPRASVFRAAAILPDSGDYQGYGQSVRMGLAAGLEDPDASFPIALTNRVSGAGEPGRLLDAFDATADTVGTFVGELLSVPTLVLATATRYARLPLISPTATDEEIGLAAPWVFQIGPSGRERGTELARTLLAQPRRVGILTSSSLEGGSFARGFAAAAESLRSAVVWRSTYAPGSTNFRDEVRALTAKRVELLFWDGEPREADALVRQLARERVTVRICGGEALAPSQHHAETQILYEGVQYVAEEWSLSPADQARLDAKVGATPEKRAGSLETRGYLAGRLLASALRSGALCPEEIAAHLERRVPPDAWSRARGFVDFGDLVQLPVYTVSRGKAISSR